MQNKIKKIKKILRKYLKVTIAEVTCVNSEFAAVLLLTNVLDVEDIALIEVKFRKEMLI